MKTLLLAAALVGAVNTERAEHGLPKLKLSQHLTHSADAFAHRLKRRGEFRQFNLAGGGAAGTIRVLHLASAPSGRHSRPSPAAR